MTDSNEGGEAGYAPFTEGRGAWRCVSDEAGQLHILATVLDFTHKTADFPDQKVARLDYDATYDEDSGKLSADVKLYFMPIEADPLDAAMLKDAIPNQISPSTTSRRGRSTHRATHVTKIAVAPRITSISQRLSGRTSGYANPSLVGQRIVLRFSQYVLTTSIIRWAKWREASMNWTSFSVTSACSGVLVRARRIVHFSRVGASKICIEGGGADRFQ